MDFAGFHEVYLLTADRVHANVFFDEKLIGKLYGSLYTILFELSKSIHSFTLLSFEPS